MGGQLTCNLENHKRAGLRDFFSEEKEDITMPTRNFAPLERVSFKVIRWIGTPFSVIFHTLIFMAIPSLGFLGFDLRSILLIFTTWLSIEAIYLAIFIQMTVNRNTQSLEEVEEDIEDIQEEEQQEEEARRVLLHIGQQMKTIQQELDILKKSQLLKHNGNGHQKVH